MQNHHNLPYCYNSQKKMKLLYITIILYYYNLHKYNYDNLYNECTSMIHGNTDEFTSEFLEKFYEERISEASSLLT